MTLFPGDKKAAKELVTDIGEDLSGMEPLILAQDSRHRGALNDMALAVTAASAGFRRSLPEPIVNALADLVRGMNCYYSNLIEGHHTHPVDIERAMRNDYSTDPAKRNLQLEAKAHVAVQQWIDQGGVKGRALTAETICELHRRFGALLPDELLVVLDPDTGRSVNVIPGVLRHDDVRVGQHLAISPGAVPRFLKRFEDVYGALGRSETILAVAAAHHRLLWIHPFLDGNGRVARLLSHAVLLDVLNTGGIWSVARGLARNVGSYKQHLMNCDSPRRNNLDGRGALSEEALAEFTKFFLELCLDQTLHGGTDATEPAAGSHPGLGGRGSPGWHSTYERRSGSRSRALPRRTASRRCSALLGTSDRQARRVVAALLECGVLLSETTRAPLLLAFPATLAARWMPGLFPEQTTES